MKYHEMAMLKLIIIPLREMLLPIGGEGSLG
jgi:hypothetical protein